jgi:uncharacterized protein
MKKSRTPKAVNAAWEVIVKSMKALSDEDRDAPLAQDLFHIMGSIKGATLLANKRGLDPEIVTIAMILHDLGRIPTGVFEGHDIAGAPLVKKLMQRIGEFTQEEIDLVVRLARTHRQKDQKGDPYEECIRDADILDIYLSGIAGWQRPMEPHRERLEKLSKELGFKIIETERDETGDRLRH